MPASSILPPPFPVYAATTVDEDYSGSIVSLHPDIIRTHILTRLDGATLASASCTTSQFYDLASQESLWTNICHSKWPSTDSPRLRHVISTFRNGPRSFFSDSFPLLTNMDLATVTDVVISPLERDRPSELISAVDIYYRGKLVFSKVVATETVSGWFRCSPFRVDMLDPKDTCPTEIPFPDKEEKCRDVANDLTLSWIVIDQIGRRAMNLSSHLPVSVHRHWLSGEVHVLFATILAGERGSSSEYVQCGILVTCGRSQSGEMQVREVSLQAEDMDGMYLNGRDTLGILRKTLEGRKGKGGRKEEEGKRRYENFLEKKRERKERKMRTEWALDIFCVTFGFLVVSSIGLFVFWR